MNIIHFKNVIPKSIFLIIIGIAITTGTELVYPHIVAPYETSLMDDDWWEIPLGQDRSFSKSMVFEDNVNDILFFVDYEPISRNLRLEVLDSDSKIVFEEEISQEKFVKTPFAPEPNSSYELRVTNLDRFYVDIWDLGYENYFSEKTSYVAPLDEWYSYVGIFVFVSGIEVAIIGGILFFKERQKNRISHMSISEKNTRDTRVNIVVQVLLCILVPLLALAAFYRINKLREGIAITLGGFALSVVLQIGLPYPYGPTAGMSFLYLIPLFFVLMWSFEWNDSISKK